MGAKKWSKTRGSEAVKELLCKKNKEKNRKQ